MPEADALREDAARSAAASAATNNPYAVIAKYVVIVIIVIVIAIFMFMASNPFKEVNQANRAKARGARKTKHACNKTCANFAESLWMSKAQAKRKEQECLSKCKSTGYSTNEDRIQNVFNNS
jgi:hypothetical protein